MGWLTQYFELSRGGGNNNVRPMEGLRGFAVSLVFLVHYVGLVLPWLSENVNFYLFANSLHTAGNTGVDLFFVLSGYLIYGSLISRPQSFPQFMSRRIERIYPAFIVVFCVYVALSFVFPAENKIPKPLASDGLIYLIQNFLLLPGFFPITPMITVAWSLSYEMFYYLLIPFVVMLFRLRYRAPVWRAVFFLCTAALAIGCCAIFGGPIRLVMFISGILLYEAMDSPLIPSPSSFVGLMALIAGLVCTLLPFEGFDGYAIKMTLLFVSFFVLCLTCFRNPHGWLPRIFSLAPLRWLGNMSYSYYLLHGLSLKAGFLALSIMLPKIGYGPWLFWALLPPMFMFTLIPTTALFLLVERPFSLAPRNRRR